ncbi:hypothetical protein EON65_21410 [archaeon]|nr:MAG: hypothetical protein EON65_21410 [archaeon]
MEKLAYRNLPGTMQHIEQWLEKHLKASLDTDTRNQADSARGAKGDNKPYYERQSAMQQLKLDRDSLEGDGLDKTAQDRIYRSFYFYCSGMHELIGDFARFEEELPTKLWMTFIRLFQHYDVQFQQKFSAFVKRQQEARSTRVINEQQGKIEQLTIENSELLEKLVIVQAESSGEKFELSIVQSSCQAMQSHWEKQANFYLRQYECCQQKINSLESLLAAYKDTVLQCKETIVRVAADHYKGKVEFNKTKAKLEGLEKEYEELSKKCKFAESNYVKMHDEMGKSKEKVMHMQQIRDDLFVTINTLTTEKKALKHTIEALEINKEQMTNLQTGLVDLINKQIKVIAGLADSNCHYHSLGDCLRLQCESIQLQLPGDLLTHKFLMSSSDETAAAIANLQAASQLYQSTSLSFSQHDYLRHMIEIRELEIALRTLQPSIQTLGQTSFLTHQLNIYTSFISLLGQKTMDYVETFKHYTEQQKDIVSRENVSKMYVDVMDKLQTALENRDATIKSKSVLIDEYATKQEELLKTIDYLETFKVKYTELEPKFLKLVQYYKTLTKEKEKLAGDLEDLAKELLVVTELREQVKVANRTIRNLEYDVRERDEHIKYLQAEVRTVSAKVLEQDNKNTVYEGLWSPLLSAVSLLSDIIKYGEQRYSSKEAVYTSIEDLSSKNVFSRLYEPEFGRRAAKVVEDLKIQKEVYELDSDIDQKISLEEKDRLLLIIKSLQELPSSILLVFRSGDEAIVAKREVEYWQREFEGMKSFSAKERSRLTRVVLSSSSSEKKTT